MNTVSPPVTDENGGQSRADSVLSHVMSQAMSQEESYRIATKSAEAMSTDMLAKFVIELPKALATVLNAFSNNDACSSNNTNSVQLLTASSISPSVSMSLLSPAYLNTIGLATTCAQVSVAMLSLVASSNPLTNAGEDIKRALVSLDPDVATGTLPPLHRSGRAFPAWAPYSGDLGLERTYHLFKAFVADRDRNSIYDSANGSEHAARSAEELDFSLAMTELVDISYARYRFPSLNTVGLPFVMGTGGLHAPSRRQRVLREYVPPRSPDEVYAEDVLLSREVAIAGTEYVPRPVELLPKYVKFCIRTEVYVYPTHSHTKQFVVNNNNNNNDHSRGTNKAGCSAGGGGSTRAHSPAPSSSRGHPPTHIDTPMMMMTSTSSHQSTPRPRLSSSTSSASASAPATAAGTTATKTSSSSAKCKGDPGNWDDGLDADDNDDDNAAADDDDDDFYDVDDDNNGNDKVSQSAHYNAFHSAAFQ